MKHINITVFGKVQGVGFRYYVCKEAELLGIKGYVKNVPTGSVYIEAEADEVLLTCFVELCKRGPVRAQVSHVDISETNVENFIGFQIRT
jgi:acylphosphatase